MLKNKILSGLFVFILFTLISTTGMALTSTDGEDISSSPSTTKILKIVGIVKMVTTATLYLENQKEYNLTNVKVMDHTSKAIPGKKKKAEMIFVNDVLEEVTIYY